VLSVAQHKRREVKGWVLVAGRRQDTNESLSTWLRAAAAHQSSESERGAREREGTRTDVGAIRSEYR